MKERNENRLTESQCPVCSTKWRTKEMVLNKGTYYCGCGYGRKKL